MSVWLASILEDEKGDLTLAMSYPTLPHEEGNESILINQLIAESLLVPLVDAIEFVVVEKRDELFSSEPIWMIEVLLRNADHEWARPGFVGFPVKATVQNYRPRPLKHLGMYRVGGTFPRDSCGRFSL